MMTNETPRNRFIDRRRFMAWTASGILGPDVGDLVRAYDPHDSIDRRCRWT